MKKIIAILVLLAFTGIVPVFSILQTVYQSSTDGRWYANINGQAYGGYDFPPQLWFSQDGTKWKWKWAGFNYQTGEKSYVNINGQTYGGYDATSIFTSFSADGTKWGFAYNVGGKLDEYGAAAGGKWYINMNGQIYGPYEKAESPRFSADGSKWGFSYQTGGKFYVNINGQIFGGYDNAETPDYLSDDGKWGFKYQSGGEKNEYGSLAGVKTYVNINGKVYGGYDQLYDPKFSLDGSKWGFCYETGGKPDQIGDIVGGKWYVNINGKVYGGYDSANIPAFSADGSKWGFGYQTDGKFYVNINGQVYGGYNGAESPAFLMDGKKWGFSYQSGGKWNVNLNGQIYSGYDAAVVFPYSSDVIKWWFFYQAGGKQDQNGIVTGAKSYFNIGGKVYGGYDFIRFPSMSADGTKFGFAYNTGGQLGASGLTGGKWFVNVDGQTFGEFPNLADFEFGPDGNARVLYSDDGNKYIIKKIGTVDVDTKIPEGERQGSALAVVIGNRDYQNGIAPVDFALKDERLMKRYFESVFKIPSERIITQENIGLTGMIGLFGTESDPAKSKLYRSVQLFKPETVYVYYSGHGIPGLKDHKGYLAPVDIDRENVEGTAYALDLLYANLSRLKEAGVKHVVVILESCFSGESESGKLVQNVSPVYMKVDNPMMADKIGSIYAATSGSDYSVWYPEMSHGLFTYYFLKGIGGDADKNKDKKITCAEMKTYLEKNVPERANIIRGFQQTPQVIGEGNDVLVRLK